MAKRQLEAFGQKFTSTAAKRLFKTKDYRCPFDQRINLCDKPNRTDLKYGSCSAILGKSKRIICPRRYYEYDYQVLRDVRNFVWNTTTFTSVYDEVKLSKKTEDDRFDYGNLDWLLVRDDDKNQFIGVEIQADSTTGTGSFATAIKDLLKDDLKENYTFGLNTLASFKGFLPQFIFKGQLFDEWKLPYVAVMQDEMWSKFISKFKIKARKIDEYNTETFMFFIYKLDEYDGRYHVKKKKVMATRWIDLLFSFAVDTDLLIHHKEARQIIDKKIEKYDSVIAL